MNREEAINFLFDKYSDQYREAVNDHPDLVLIEVLLRMNETLHGVNMKLDAIRNEIRLVR